MKFIYISLSIVFTVITLNHHNTNLSNYIPRENHIQKTSDSVLRHVVLFKFKEGTTRAEVKKVEDAFSVLPSKIPEIKSYEWGLNNSPEGFDKGFTHCFFLTFMNEADRAIYLPHPDHKAFGEVLGSILDDVLVFDYWTN